MGAFKTFIFLVAKTVVIYFSWISGSWLFRGSWSCNVDWL